MAEIPISSDLRIGTGLDSATGVSHRVAIDSILISENDFTWFEPLFS